MAKKLKITVKKYRGKAPTLKSDRLGGTPATGRSYKRSKASIAAEKKAAGKKTLSQIKTRTRTRKPYSKSITRVQVGKKKK